MLFTLPSLRLQPFKSLTHLFIVAKSRYKILRSESDSASVGTINVYVNPFWMLYTSAQISYTLMPQVVRDIENLKRKNKSQNQKIQQNKR